MSGLILPPGVGSPAPEVNVNIQLNDSELEALLEGPVAWAQSQAGKSLNIDKFVNAFREKIEALGFTVEIKVYDTDQPNTYKFEAEINGRQDGSAFDPDRQVHEVVNNYLGLKGEQEGFIPVKEGYQKFLDREFKKSNGNHHH